MAFGQETGPDAPRSGTWSKMDGSRDGMRQVRSDVAVCLVAASWRILVAMGGLLCSMAGRSASGMASIRYAHQEPAAYLKGPVAIIDHSLPVARHAVHEWPWTNTSERPDASTGVFLHFAGGCATSEPPRVVVRHGILFSPASDLVINIKQRRYARGARHGRERDSS